MLTFTIIPKGGVRVAGGSRPLNVYPKETVKGEVTLLATPQEELQNDIVSWPGEYDIAGITIRGIGQDEGQEISFVVEIEETRIAFPASPLKEWADTEIERLGDVHILVLPGDQDAKLCQKLLEDVDPRMLMIVPGEGGKIDPEVLKTCGATGKEQVSEFKTKGSFGAEGREVVVFG